MGLNPTLFQIRVNELNNMSDEQLLVMRTAINQQLIQRDSQRIVMIDHTAIEKTPAYQAGFVKAHNELAELLNGPAKEFNIAWIHAGGSMDTLLKLVQCSPGPDTTKAIKETAEKMLGGLSNLDNTIRQINSQAKGSFYVDQEQLAPYVEKMQEMHKKVNHFFDLSGSDKAFQWLRESVRETYFNASAAMNAGRVKTRGRGDKKGNWLTVEYQRLKKNGYSQHQAIIHIRTQLEKLTELTENDDDLKLVQKTKVDGKEDGEAIRKLIDMLEKRINRNGNKLLPTK